MVFFENPLEDKLVGKRPWFASATCDVSAQIQTLRGQLEEEKAERVAELQTERDARVAELQAERVARRLQLEAATTPLQQHLDNVATLTFVPFINNVAVQALHFAVGLQPKAVDACSTFKRLAKEKDTRLKNFVKGAFGDKYTTRHCAGELDKLIDSRNGQQHVPDVGALIAAKDKALELADQHAVAGKACSTALYVLEGFNDLMAALSCLTATGQARKCKGLGLYE